MLEIRLNLSRLQPALALLLVAASLLGACSRVENPAAPSPIATSGAVQAAPTLAPATAAPTKVPAGPVIVNPVEGMPQGSQGYPWWNDSTFYEIFVRSFFDSNGDGIGDFNGLTAKLDYLNDGDPDTTTDLGITGIWLMPIFPSPSYHGYDATDYTSVNPDYGSLDDFKHLLNEAHRRGIRVIIDMMLNHTSVDHPWFKASMDPASPYRNWYIWSDTDPGGLGPWGEQVWHPSPNGKGYFYGVFWEGMPDLNYQNPAVTQEMEKVTRFWLQDVKVDGLRLDGARYIVEEGKNQADAEANHEWLGKYTTFVKSLNPEALVVGEIWTSSFTVASYTKKDQVDLGFNFDLASAFIKSANTGNAGRARDQLTLDQRAFPPLQFAPFLTNHDQNRVLSELGGDLEKAKNAAFLLLTAPGVPFIYYGEEVGILGKKPDEMIRTPMQWSGEAQAGFTTGSPWEAVNPFFSQSNVASESTRPASLLAWYQTLVHLRNQHEALRVGDALLVKASSGAETASTVYALLRASQNEVTLSIVNLGKDPVENFSLSLDSGSLSGAYQVFPLVGQGQFPELNANAKGGFDGYSPVATLPAYARLVLQLQKP